MQSIKSIKLLAQEIKGKQVKEAVNS